MSDKNRGFSSMDKKKREEIAQKGGEARKREIGPEGYSEIGKKGGEAKRGERNQEDYSEKGGESRKEKMSNDEKGGHGRKDNMSKESNKNDYDDEMYDGE